MTRVWFVRHAEPDLSNHDELSRGLSSKGLADCELVKRYLDDQAIIAAYSSPYKRSIDTIKPFADANHLEIQIVDAFRERKISNSWIADFDGFCKQQWLDFAYKLDDGESLREVQQRNITALEQLLLRHRDENILIGSHGTAMSTVINYYNHEFGYESFRKIKGLMPWIVCMEFDGFGFLGMHAINLLDN